jgi:CRP-like cAMP-binding protein
MATHDLDLLVRKLRSRTDLSEDDRQAILALPFTRRTVVPGAYLAREGDRPSVCTALISGYAFRHKIVGNGGRQILSLHVPGEAVDFQSLHLDTVDHNVQMLGHGDVAVIPMKALRDLVAARPAIARAILVDTLVDASVFREWIANVGRRNARERLAHLMCEFACRLEAQQLVRDDGIEFPMTQEQLGDALGLTSVHVNRSIRSLEDEGLITRKRRMLTFPNAERLRQVADFNSLYLHLHTQQTPA